MPKAIKTHNANTWTEAQFWSFIRSMLRKGSFRWKPRLKAKLAARRVSQSANKRLQYEYQCASCLKWFPDKETAVDHKEPCGALRKYEDLPPFVRKLYVDNADAYQVLCKGVGSCHQLKCNEEKLKKKYEQKN